MVSGALEEVASTAEEVARDQQQVARRVRRMQRQRARGWSWARILDGDDEPGVFDLLRRSARRLTTTAGRFGRAVAAGLAAEGESRRKIAGRLGVTHQRVTAMLSGRQRAAGGGSARAGE